MPKSKVRKRKYPYVIKYLYPGGLCDIPNCPKFWEFKVRLEDKVLHLCEHHFINEFGMIEVDEYRNEIP